MKQVLVLDFIDSLGRRFTIRISDPREDLTPEEVEATMNLIIGMNPFNREALVSIEKANIVTTTEEQVVFA